MRRPNLPASRRAIAVVVVLALTAACASPPRSPLTPVTALNPGDDPWAVVMGLEAGRLVVVGLAPGSAAHAAYGEQLRARVVAADRSSLELRTGFDDTTNQQAGVTLALPSAEVRYLQVRASQDRRRQGGWLGAGIGVAAGAALGARGATEEGSFWPITVALFGAGLGFLGWLIGRGVDRKRTAGDFITVYGIE